jgi:hypothetical protein
MRILSTSRILPTSSIVLSKILPTRPSIQPGCYEKSYSSSRTVQEGPINTIATANNVDWDDRIGLQQKWTLVQKGWKVQVEWRSTAYGAGLFAAQDIAEGELLRLGKNGVNLIQFQSLDDIDTFLGMGDEGAYRARLYYVKDYLWGFSPHADERGYDIPDCPLRDRFFGMWIPGNGLNHSKEPNTVYRPASTSSGTGEGINLIALRDIANGEELYDDYRRHGKAPEWLLEFALKYNVSLNFADCNDFVNDASSS